MLPLIKARGFNSASLFPNQSCHIHTVEAACSGPLEFTTHLMRRLKHTAAATSIVVTTDYGLYLQVTSRDTDCTNEKH